MKVSDIHAAVLGSNVQIFQELFSITHEFFCGRNKEGSIELASLFKLTAALTDRFLARIWLANNLRVYAINTSFDLRFRQSCSLAVVQFSLTRSKKATGQAA